MRDPTLYYDASETWRRGKQWEYAVGIVGQRLTWRDGETGSMVVRTVKSERESEGGRLPWKGPNQQANISLLDVKEPKMA